MTFELIINEKQIAIGSFIEMKDMLPAGFFVAAAQEELQQWHTFLFVNRAGDVAWIKPLV